MLRQRLLGDILQTSAILDEQLHVLSSLTDPNDYAGPGTGYRLSPERRERWRAYGRSGRPPTSRPSRSLAEGCIDLAEIGPARAGVRPDEIVVGLSPAFGVEIWTALNGMTVAEVLRQVLAGIEEEGLALASRPCPALDRPRLHRLDGGTPLGLRRLGRAPGEGNGPHPSRRPAAAREPRALLDRTARDRRALPRASAGTRPATRKAQPPEPLLLPESSEPLGTPLPRSRRAARRHRAAALERGGAGRAGGDVAELSYPLSADARDAVRTASGKRRVRAHARGRSHRRRRPQTTCASRRRRSLSRPTSPSSGGNPQLAENLRRGAELVAFSDDELLRFYEMLRPGRSSDAELDELAATLAERGAERCAAMVQEARAAYVRRGLIA